jgi:DNA-directed RNA polymerase subunit N (RpoN/RPB10)
MLIPIRCFTCGSPLSDIYTYYEEYKEKNMDNNDIFKLLAIDMDCCKIHIMNSMKLHDYL